MGSRRYMASVTERAAEREFAGNFLFSRYLRRSILEQIGFYYPTAVRGWVAVGAGGKAVFPFIS